MKNAVLAFLHSGILQLNRFKGQKASKFWYRYLNKLLKDAPDVCFLNYGYAPLDGEQIPLEEKDEAHRIFIQLYHSVSSAIDLSGLDVLEVSCGRGGGARYVKHYLKPSMMIGVDRAENAVAFCKKHQLEDGLYFACGDAQAMPFADGRFDAIVNVEASHDYPDMNQFLSEVARVLRPGGYLLYADFRRHRYCEAWRRQLVQSGFTIVQEEDITANVLRGLELNTKLNMSLIKRLAPTLLWPLFSQFAGTKGSLVYWSFDSGRASYRRFVLRKES